MKDSSPQCIPSAVVHEVFSGIQGEGVHVGFRQLFVRFHGCPFACAYCDTPASHDAPPEMCTAEVHAGGRDFASLPNPLDVATLLQVLQQLNAGFPHHSVSLTGGEPLLHRPFLDALLPELAHVGLPTYLETNGLEADALQAMAVFPDYVAMDIKLPSVTGMPAQWTAHEAFLLTALARLGGCRETLAARVQIKMVFGEESLDEIAQATRLVATICPDLPCVLQPVTPIAGGPCAPGVATVLAAQQAAARYLRDARVIPQTHVLLGQR